MDFAAADGISSQPPNIYHRWQQEAALDNIMTMAVSNCSYFQGSGRLDALSFISSFFFSPLPAKWVCCPTSHQQQEQFLMGAECADAESHFE